ncbi:Fic family protein [Microbacterium profundi]|uniref:Fic family protein n=1 Tax=Microbacterium profundi TaxID=450380 RepID=UPI001F35D7CA|nr:Fic family protein [Microbacterium profundi]MCE7482166.1 Fic family protein [Microbacterium profundi]
MINRVTWDRLEAVIADYRATVEGHPEALAQIARAELAESVQQSNAIENSTLTLDDTERILAGLMPAARRDLREVYEAKNLAAVTESLMTDREPFSVDLILRWHSMLLAGIRDDVAGRFRHADEWVRVGAHLGANPAFVADLVADALTRFHDDASMAPLERIAWFHCEFEVIHPFVDGNGRIGRMLINKQLQVIGLPAVIVRARNRRVDYYSLLAQYAKSSSHDGMTRLLALLVLESLHKRIALISSRRVIPLADWARAAGISGAAAANKAKRQTIPAFRMRDRWMVAEDYR